MKITFLGTGPSQGLPIIGGTTAASLSSHPKDQRLRSSILIEVEGKSLVVDCGPDFRQQMLREKVKRLDAILFTHEHNDHINGLDDIRPFCFMQKKAMPLYCTAYVASRLRHKYDYMFHENPYPGVPEVQIHHIHNSLFEVEGVKVLPIPLPHGSTVTTAYRIGNFAYIVDANGMSKEAEKALQELDVLVINALRYKPHHSHFTLNEALEVVEKLNPKEAYITAVGPELPPHNELEASLPSGVYVAFDGLSLNL